MAQLRSAALRCILIPTFPWIDPSWRDQILPSGNHEPTVRREKARRATRGHYGKAETVIHCSKKDEIARGREGGTDEGEQKEEIVSSSI